MCVRDLDVHNETYISIRTFLRSFFTAFAYCSKQTTFQKLRLKYDITAWAYGLAHAGMHTLDGACVRLSLMNV